MKIVEVYDIERQQLAVEYRRMYRANVKIAAGPASFTSPVEFTLEMTPFGTYDIGVRFLDSPDFPVVPATNLLRDSIAELNKQRRLP